MKPFLCALLIASLFQTPVSVQTGSKESGDTPARVHAQEGVMASKRKATSNAHGGSNLTGLGVSADQTCYGYTGGSCSVMSCDERRKATCQSGYCVCDVCADVHGICTTERNTFIAEGFRLYNVKWPDYRIIVPAMTVTNKLQVSKASGILGQETFDLYKLPGTNGGKPSFFLGTVKSESTVLAFTEESKAGFNTFTMYAKDLNDAIAPDSLAVALCARQDGSIMIGSVGELTAWAYIRHGTYFLHGTDFHDPGGAAHWTPQPALPANVLPACSS